MKTINIMTSCDGNLMKYIPVQLESITLNLADRQINFYLFHDGKNQDRVNKLKEIKYNNITLSAVIFYIDPVVNAPARAREVLAIKICIPCQHSCSAVISEFSDIETIFYVRQVN